MNSTIRTFIADDHALVIQGLKCFFSSQDEMNVELIGECQSLKKVFEAVKEHKPNILLLDLNMPDGSSFEVLKSLRKNYDDPLLRIIALTAYDDPKMVKDFFNFGGDGYVLKTSGLSEILTAIEVVLKGKIYTGTGVRIVAANTLDVGVEIVKKDGFKEEGDEKRFLAVYKLTKRELEVLKLIANGLSNKKIANSLFISDQTVSVHRKNIMRKLSVHNIAGLVKIAYYNNIL